MKSLKLIFIVLIGTLTMACSQQYRSSGAEIYEEDVIELMNEVLNVQGIAGLTVSDFDPQFTSYYVAQSGADKMGDVMSVLSFGYMDFLGYSNQSIIDVDPLEASVIFMDVTDMQGLRSFHLYIKTIDVNGGTNVHSFQPTAADHFFFEDGSFEAYLSGDFSDIVVYSDDVDENFGNELNGTIQLKIDEIINGQRYYIGKISVLTGFGGIN